MLSSIIFVLFRSVSHKDINIYCTGLFMIVSFSAFIAVKQLSLPGLSSEADATFPDISLGLPSIPVCIISGIDFMLKTWAYLHGCHTIGVRSQHETGPCGLKHVRAMPTTSIFLDSEQTPEAPGRNLVPVLI